MLNIYLKETIESKKKEIRSQAESEGFFESGAKAKEST